MIIGIHPDRMNGESFSERWTEAIHQKGLETRTLNLLAPDALIQARNCDAVMWRWAHNPQDKQSAQRILYTIEHILGIPVFPNSRTAWHFDEKISQYYLLQGLKAPVPATWIFWDPQQAFEWSHTATYPLVFKLSSGAGSANVRRVDSSDDARRLIEQAFGRGFYPYGVEESRSQGSRSIRLRMNAALARLPDAARYSWRGRYPSLHPVWWKVERGYAYFQAFLPDNPYDTRVTVIGDRAFAFRRWNRQDDFRASGSGKLDYNRSDIDQRCVEIAFDLSERGGFQSMAYDFLLDRGEPVITEISYTFADQPVYNCPGHWRRDLSWVDGHLWPEEAQVEYFLQSIQDAQKARE